MGKHKYGEFYQQMRAWLSEDHIKYREDIVDGLESAPEAIIGLLKGEHFGKLIVKIANE